MRKLHIIEEPSHRIGGEIYYREDKERYMSDSELREAFEAGCEHGYRKAQREMEDYSERKYDRDGRIIQYRHDPDRDWDDDDMDWRRRRRANGRFY